MKNDTGPNRRAAPAFALAIPPLLATLLVTLLTGCASDPERYPSLAIRNFERVEGRFAVGGGIAALPAPAAPGPATIAQVGSLLEAASQVHREFLAAVGETERLIDAAQGLGPESNAWAEAQIALAVLDNRRALLTTRLADLDLLRADASLAYEQLTEVDAARSAVESLAAEEDRILDGLVARSQ